MHSDVQDRWSQAPNAEHLPNMRNTSPFFAGIKKPRRPRSTGLSNVEAEAGIEPAWADLQSTIFSLKIISLRIIRFRKLFIFWQLNAKHMKGLVLRCGTDLAPLARHPNHRKTRTLNRPGFFRHSPSSLRNAFQTLPGTADC